MSEKRKLTVPRGRSPDVVTVTKLTTAGPLPAAVFDGFGISSGCLAGPSEQGCSQRIRIEVETVEDSRGAIRPFDLGQGHRDVLDPDMAMSEI
jgi:hypothetical protein